MKRTRISVFLLLVAVLCGVLSSCVFFGPAKAWEEGKLTNTFFGADYLAERGVADFSVPKLEGSYFDPEDNILYLNLTREEFDTYTSIIVTYLREKEELAVKGYHCGDDVWGLLLIPIRVYQLAPLETEKISYLDDNKRLFGFSTQEPNPLSDGESEVRGVKFVSLSWEPTTQDSGASYTTVMQFPTLTQRAEYLPCHHGHDFESVTYPVPGTVFTTTINTCKLCREKTREGYDYGYEEEKFSWTVVEGTEYLVAGMHKLEYRGSLVEIATKAPEGVKLKMTISGTDIPVVRELDGEQVFAFIMPYGSVNVTIEEMDPTPLPPEAETENSES